MKLLVLILLLSFQVKAGVRHVGNGGTGVLVNGQPQLLDLYEAGLQNPFIDETVVPNPTYVKAFTDFDILSASEKTKLTQKLTEIRKYSPVTADLIVIGMQRYLWRVLDVTLKGIPDTSLVNIDEANLVQLANRLGTTIRISKKYWDMMDEGHKVALVIHEILYAYEKPVEVRPGVFEQLSQPVRERIGYFFSPEFKTRGQEGFTDFTGLQRRYSEITSDSSLEVVDNSLYVQDIGFISLADPTLSVDNFCGKLEGYLISQQLKTANLPYNYHTIDLKIHLRDYSAGDVQQKWIEVEDVVFIKRSYQVGQADFQKGDREACVNWASIQAKNVTLVQSLPTK